MAEKRYDNKRRLLRSGETQRADGYYTYRWTSRNGKRNSITAKSLEELREKEEELLVNKRDGIRVEAVNTTVNDIFELWKRLKRGLKDNTFQNYCYMYNMFLRDDLGKLKVQKLRKSDVKRFYNGLIENKNLKISTVDNIHTVLHQVLTVAVEDGYTRMNVSDNVLKELKQSHNADNEKRRALTVEEERLFLDFLKSEKTEYHHWYPIFAVMLGTGMRVGEVTGLTWTDIDFENNMIEVNRTLVYYKHAVNGCYFNIHTPKTAAGRRNIPMLDFVKEALLEEKRYQEYNGLKSEVAIDGCSDFVFINRFGNVQNQSTLNRALRRIIVACNDQQFKAHENPKVLLPRFSCHNLRHSFTTRLIEKGVNVAVVKDVLGHSDVSTTLNIYTTVTRELQKTEFEKLQDKMNDV